MQCKKPKKFKQCLAGNNGQKNKDERFLLSRWAGLMMTDKKKTT